MKVRSIVKTSYLNEGQEYEAVLFDPSKAGHGRHGMTDAYDTNIKLRIGEDYFIPSLDLAYSRSRFEELKMKTPTYAPGTRVKYRYNYSTTYTIGESKLDDSGKEVAQLNCGSTKYGFYPVSDITSTEPVVVDPKKGDRIELSITAVVQGAVTDGLLLQSEASGAFFINKADINGRPVVLKPKSPPWKMGQRVGHDHRTYHVQTLLTNDWCVLLREGTTADFKLAHKNDPSFVR